MTSCVTLDNTSGRAQGVGSRQTGAPLPALWACGREPASIWDPYAQVSQCWQRSSASGDSRYYFITLIPPAEVTVPAGRHIFVDRHIPVFGHAAPISISQCMPTFGEVEAKMLNCEMEQLMHKHICWARCRGSNLWNKCKADSWWQ